MTKEQILAIKVGDQWLDSSTNFLGTCTYRAGTEFHWTWHSVGSGKFHHTARENDINSLVRDINNIHWIMLTPLLKELL